MRWHSPRSTAALVGLGIALITLTGCDSPTDSGEGVDDDGALVPPPGRRGVGIPLLTHPPVEEELAPTEATPTDPGDNQGVATALSSAPDGSTLRLAGTFVDPSDGCEVRVPGMWTEELGWTRVATATDDGTKYGITTLGDGGHMLGWRGNCGYGGAVYWPSASTPELYLADFYPAGVNAAGDVVGNYGGFPAELIVASPDAAGGLTYRNVHRELLSSLGFASSRGIDINDRGQILAYGLVDDSTGRAERVLLIDGLVVHDLGSGLDLGSLEAHALNNANPVQVAGTAQGDPLSREDNQALRWTFFSEDSIVVEALTGPEGSPAAAADIDDAGNVYGTTEGILLQGDPVRSLLWRETDSGFAVIDVGPVCLNFALAADHSAHLAGVARVLTCGGLFEVQLD